ncbi:hypothetical protein ACSMX9_25350 [Streptomyces sp. LE64]|uniref:hypothetical protein n=1 Tax=Streptomyces sp. LE64 TaxID=3448653 RepID=UPI0040411925
MKRLWELLGFLALLQGVMGIAHRYAGREWGVVRRVPFFEGHELFVSLCLILLSFTLFGVAGSTGKRSGGPGGREDR